MAAVNSSWSLFLRDTVGTSGGLARGFVVPIDRGSVADRRSALLRAGVLLALRFLALPLHARLLVVLAPASLGENAALLDLLVEAAKGALERLVFPHSDVSQSRDHLLRPGVLSRPGRPRPGAILERGVRKPGQGRGSLAEPSIGVKPTRRSGGEARWHSAVPGRAG